MPKKSARTLGYSHLFFIKITLDRVGKTNVICRKQVQNRLLFATSNFQRKVSIPKIKSGTLLAYNYHVVSPFVPLVKVQVLVKNGETWKNLDFDWRKTVEKEGTPFESTEYPTSTFSADASFQIRHTCWILSTLPPGIYQKKPLNNKITGH